MDNVIVIDNLSYKCGGKVIFNNLSFSLKKGSFTTLLSNNGSGKTSLVRLLSGLKKYTGSIYITNVLLEKKTRNTILSKIGFVFEDVDTILFSERVIDNLVFHLQCLNYSNDYIIHRVNEISKYLGIEYLLNRCCSDLSGSEKQLVCLACALITGPELLILDNAFSMITDKRKKDLLAFLTRINHDFGVTILNMTNDIEESVYGDDILILDNGSVLIHDNKENVYKQEKLLNDLGFDLPFMVSLSNKLSYYDLLDSVIYNMEDMVDLLWK